MKGLELCRACYGEYGQTILAPFPRLEGRAAAGLAGEGSECLGYDDTLSRDHDFGPGFCLWLTEEDFEQYGEALQEAYDALPGEFMGFPARRGPSLAGKRVGVFSIPRFYRRFLGRSEAPGRDVSHALEWLALGEENLAVCVNGEVFSDPLGEFTAVRRELLAFYPEEVRRKKIAARAAKMAQAGQYNHIRCVRRGEEGAALLALGEFMRAAGSMVHLLNRRYAPYYKWLIRSARELPLLGEAGRLLEGLPARSPMERQEGIEEVCALVGEELRRQGLTDKEADFLQVQGEDIMARLTHPALRGLHLLEG